MNYAQKLLRAAVLLISCSSATAATVDCTVSGGNKWIPSHGWLELADDKINASNSHYVRQYLYWRTPVRLTWFHANADSTYEPDVYFYNYDQLGVYGYAPLGYWASDLPAPYIDTQAFDSEDEKAVTVGSAAASLIKPGVMYTTVTRMTWVYGPHTNGMFKAQSQRGRRLPSSCYSTNCSFGCSQLQNNVRTVDFQSYRKAPGKWKWQWEDPNNWVQPW